MVTKGLRIDWIDSEKGFILFLVCMYHIELFSVLAPCRMPVFFFLSGMLFSNRRYSSFASFVFRKWHTLLLPYLLLSFLFVFLFPGLYDSINLLYGDNTVLAVFIGKVNCPELLRLFLIKLYIFSIDIFLGHSSPTTVGLWFVYSLFQISCIFYLVHKAFANNKYSSFYLLFFCISCLLSGWLMSYFNVSVPFNIPTMITGLAFYTMGYLGKLFFMDPDNSPSFINCVGMIVLMLALYIIGIKLIDSSIIVYRTNYLSDSFWGYLLASISGTWLVTFIFFIINKIHWPFLQSFKKFFCAVLKLIAENGMVILTVHLWSFCLFNYIFSDYADGYIYIYWRLCWVILITLALIPFFNKYLYWMIGKDKCNE